MKYKFFKLTNCPGCNHAVSKRHNNCPNCNLYIKNHCTNASCKSVLDNNARFCHNCGSISFFYLNNILVDWESEKEELDRRTFCNNMFEDDDDFFIELNLNL